MGRLAVVLVALTVGCAGATAGAVEIGWTTATFGFEVSPKKLSRTQPTHARLSLSGRYETTDGSQVPALRELTLEGDRRLALDLTGVPACRGPILDYRGALEDACGDSVIGRGEVQVEVRIAEMLVPVTGAITLYKGVRKAGGRSVIGNLALPAPVTAEIGIPVLIRRIDDGRLGWSATAEVPRIAGGNGTIAGYSVRIGRRFLTATCGDKRLELRVVSRFDDGARLLGSALRACVPLASRAGR